MADTVFLVLQEQEVLSDYAGEQPWRSQSSPEGFIFDPNTATHEQLLRLGIGNQAAGNIIKIQGQGRQIQATCRPEKRYMDSVATNMSGWKVTSGLKRCRWAASDPGFFRSRVRY